MTVLGSKSAGLWSKIYIDIFLKLSMQCLILISDRYSDKDIDMHITSF